MLKRGVKLTYSKEEWVHLKDKEACPKRHRLKTHSGKGSDVLNIPLSCQNKKEKESMEVPKGISLEMVSVKTFVTMGISGRERKGVSSEK